jgi:hypothetical protein
MVIVFCKPNKKKSLRFCLETNKKIQYNGLLCEIKLTKCCELPST